MMVRNQTALDDRPSPARYDASEDSSYLNALSALPPEIVPRQITLRDRVTAATLVPFSSHIQVPISLLSYLCDQLNREIERGDTYPMTEAMPLERFAPYWFANFGAVMVLGDLVKVQSMLSEDTANQRDWNKDCLGSFYVKPNYPGRSGHICNGGFLVTDASRNRGVGRLMGEGYIDWAPKLGYTYSVFNLVYETNIASTRIWDGLGFKRIGRVPGCGSLRSHPDRLVDAIIYGRELAGAESDEFVSEERFDKIRYYLKHNRYPAGADRAEKSRLRSAATHYRLVPSDEGAGNADDDGAAGRASPAAEKLMLKGKEVISDPQRQYEIAKTVHAELHAGINKMTKTIAQRYHWTRIKETVSLVISNCPGCKDYGRPNGESGAADEPKTSAAAVSEPMQQQQQQHLHPDPLITEPSNFPPRPRAGYSPPAPAPAPRDFVMQYSPYRTTVDPRLTHHTTASDMTMDIDSDGVMTAAHTDAAHYQAAAARYKIMDAERAAVAAREALQGFTTAGGDGRAREEEDGAAVAGV